MKKLISMLLLLTLLSSLGVVVAGCGSEEPEIPEAPSAEEPPIEETPFEENAEALPESIDLRDPFSRFSSFPEFDVLDISGNPMSDEVFNDHRLTLVNIWTTNCGYCITELSVLDDLHLEMKDEGVNVMGIVADGMINKEMAQYIIEKLSINYTNVIPDEKLIEDFVIYTIWVPVSVLVDSEGNLVGNTISGGRSKDEYREILQEALKEIGEKNEEA